jgi:hypothetical protein
MYIKKYNRVFCNYCRRGLNFNSLILADNHAETLSAKKLTSARITGQKTYVSDHIILTDQFVD